MRPMRSRLVAGLHTRPGSFALALNALLLIAAGFAVDSWMLNTPSHVRAACTDSRVDTTYITADGNYCEAPNPLIQPWFGVVIAALGVGVLVMAWTVDRRPLERPRRGFRAFRAWGAPLLWLALVPIIAVPLASSLFDSEVRATCQITPDFIFGYTAECPVSALVPSVLIPGLLNLVPLRWLWTANPRTRIAAVVASALGAAGFVGGLWGLYVQGPTVEVNSGFVLPDLPPQGPYGLALGTAIWLLTLISLLVIAKLPLGMADFKLATRTPAG